MICARCHRANIRLICPNCLPKQNEKIFSEESNQYDFNQKIAIIREIGKIHALKQKRQNELNKVQQILRINKAQLAKQLLNNKQQLIRLTSLLHYQKEQSIQKKNEQINMTELIQKTKQLTNSMLLMYSQMQSIKNRIIDDYRIGVIPVKLDIYIRILYNNIGNSNLTLHSGSNKVNNQENALETFLQGQMVEEEKRYELQGILYRLTLLIHLLGEKGAIILPFYINKRTWLQPYQMQYENIALNMENFEQSILFAVTKNMIAILQFHGATPGIISPQNQPMKFSELAAIFTSIFTQIAVVRIQQGKKRGVATKMGRFIPNPSLKPLEQ